MPYENPPISSGEPSTLKTYRRIAQFGEDEEVVQDERQMLYLFSQIQFGGGPEDPAVIFCEAEGTIPNRWIE